MSTLYTHRLTVACPESLIEAANHVAVSIGESGGDFESFQLADWVDSLGNRYAVASMQCTDRLIQKAATMLERREFAPDEWSFELASFAQSKIQLWLGEGKIPSAKPDAIVGIVLDDPMTAIQLLGITRISE